MNVPWRDDSDPKIIGSTVRRRPVAVQGGRSPAQRILDGEWPTPTLLPQGWPHAWGQPPSPSGGKDCPAPLGAG